MTVAISRTTIGPAAGLEVLCSPSCPYMDKPHASYEDLACVCGRKVLACGHCVEAGRVMFCLPCSQLSGPRRP